MRSYSETLEFLYSRLPMYQRSGPAAYKPDLGNTLELCEAAGNPQNRIKTIHVAGTNGKGSVSHFLASIFSEAGYKTGLYTSPHLLDFRERIRVNGVMIPEGDVVRFTEKITNLLPEIEPSFFEMTVAMAFAHFADVKTDIAIIETGLGGRLDSTNVITPELSVITNIGYDHTALLGNTLEKIAGEKAGIIKNNVPVVIGEYHSITAPVFLQAARSRNAVLHFSDSHYSCIPANVTATPGPMIVNIMNDNAVLYENVESALNGTYQLKNIATVARVFDNLKTSWNLKEMHLRNGLRNVKMNTGLRGRWELLNEKPAVICDTGHNAEGLSLVMAQLGKIRRNKLHMVIGMVSDKDPVEVLKLFPKNANYYFCRASIPRAMDAAQLKRYAHDAGLEGDTWPTVEAACKAAYDAADAEHDLIFVGGSTFVVAEALEIRWDKI